MQEIEMNPSQKADFARTTLMALMTAQAKRPELERQLKRLNRWSLFCAGNCTKMLMRADFFPPRKQS
jgi:hypothetical protein